MRVFLNKKEEPMDKESFSLDFISNLFEKKQEKQIINYIFDELDENTIIEKLINLYKSEQEND